MALLFDIEPKRYQHDCEECEYLGRYEKYDLYVHRNSDDSINTVIARYGSDGPEYTSGLASMVHIGALAVAFIRANAEIISGINIKLSV